MIKFKRLKYKNFLSTGNAPVEIILDENPRTIIVGENGQGKSTIISALTFALFGKDYRGINKPQLVNSINRKGLEVEVEFETRGKNYIIRRGIAPAIFEVYMDGNLVNQTAFARDYQEYIEQNVLKLNFGSFKQIVVLGSNNYVPFMRLTAANRRTVIEDLLDITIFSKMNVLLKAQLSETKEYISDLETKVVQEQEKANIVLKHLNQIKEMKNDMEKRHKEDADKYTQIIEETREANQKLATKRAELSDKLKAITDTLKKKTDVLNEYKTIGFKREEVKKKLSFLEKNEQCHLCLQHIEHEHKNSQVASLTSALQSHDQEMNDLTEKLSRFGKVEEMYTKLSTNVTILDKEINAGNSKINVNMKLLEKLQTASSVDTDNSEAHMNTLLEDLQSHNEKVQTYSREKDKQVAQKELESVAYMLLKDNGIKTKIIQSYIPYMNSLINEYLKAMNFYVSFELDENFNEKIRSRHRDVFSYENFSEGEKQRIDLALLFAWRQIARRKNSMSTNILFLDETFDSSMDGVGVDDLVKILYTLEGNIFLISHRENMIDKFDKIIKFEKVNNFTTAKVM